MLLLMVIMVMVWMMMIVTHDDDDGGGGGGGGGYRYSRYILDETLGLKEVSGAQAKQSRGLGFFSFDLKSYFDKDINWRGNPLIQTIEPRFYFLFQEYVDQTRIPVFDVANFQSGYSRLFRRDHFAGIDRLADANKVVLVR